LGNGASAWLHVVFAVAIDRKQIDIDRYVRWSASLIQAGHAYLGVSGLVLARAARIDAIAGNAPGDLLTTISLMIGGRTADRVSHVNVVVGCLIDLWKDHTTASFRQPVTGFILDQLVRERTNDYDLILRTVLERVRNLPALTAYIHTWLRGHFLFGAVLSP
jgi:hypothetical protein